MRVTTAAVLMVACTTAAYGIEVNEFASTPSPGVWYENDVRAGGVASIEDLTGAGGNLEANQPLPIGAAKLTTGFSNDDKAEVGVADSYGAMGDITSTLSFSYSYYKEAVGGGNAFAAPSLKLTIFNPTPTQDPDGFITLIYEPTWNQPSNPGASLAVPTGDWQTVNIDADNGLFWGTGGFGTPNGGGGPPLWTLNQWLNAANTDALSAELLQVSIGVGTYNQGMLTYFDDVSIRHDGYSASYDFEPNIIPTPAAFGAGILGLMALATRRAR
ncbi:hypothetical protein [Mucisphaera calidilacus]|uniref:Uncharacterized protein n=1 Tax=Mucisphaera calidilacus TaxID=2527982 RepID=A0A518C0Y6_9BACT|nr:hypothetical protein [Mucisphaera calidilacus]QDU72893.1 hypothetical protein Pan265_27690 [Mucisphaera calidilacus]